MRQSRLFIFHQHSYTQESIRTVCQIQKTDLSMYLQLPNI